MKNTKLFASILLGLVLAGCSGYQYYAIQSNTVSLAKFRTFAWLPAPDTSGTISDISDERIKDEITAGLERRGLLLQTARPDLLVRYTVQVKDRIRTYNYPTYVYGPSIIYRGVGRNRYGRYFYYNYTRPYPVFVGSDIVQVPYREGTLIIDLIERRGHRVIWRGYGVGNVDDPERAVRDIPEVVDGILNKLPIVPLTPRHN